MKMWDKDKGTELNEFIENFTVGNDKAMDQYLAKHDVIGSLAHIQMLNRVQLLSNEEFRDLRAELLDIYTHIKEGKFLIEDGVEDVHSQVEMMLTRKLGAAGEKIHTGRSRNDQVLLDIKLFSRDKLEGLVTEITRLFNTLISQSGQYKDVLMPGYTHLQVAMPSSFGLWFGAYAESLSDDLIMLNAAYEIVNQNPLGSAAGYGSSFPLDRQYTTDLLGFQRMNYNSIYAQMNRGKMEMTVSRALASVAQTLGKLAMDVCLFMSQNFGFVSLPDEFTTGSSIMPHKKNPDVFEILRAKCNTIESLPNTIFSVANNLPSGYFRDYQLLKEKYLPAFDTMIECVQITSLAVENLIINRESITDEKYKYMFSVEEVNKKVQHGSSFREAYRSVAEDIENGTFSPDKQVNHVHEGSTGNLCNDRISEKFFDIKSKFPFEHVNTALELLLEKGDISS